MTAIPRDPWAKLAHLTPARIAPGRAGSSLPTRAVLDFALAHAQARDAVHAPLDIARLRHRLAGLSLPTVDVESRAGDRQTYLRRPDLGRALSAASRARLLDVGPSGFDVALMLGDGLSATAVEAHAPALVEAFLPLAARLGLDLAPLVIATQARVALGDEIGSLLQARLVVVLIGERPGLSAADSLGIYVTYAPSPGRTDAERNCISNVRPEGFTPERAARSLTWLVEAALARGLTGVGLKDESEVATIGAATQPRSLPKDA